MLCSHWNMRPEITDKRSRDRRIDTWLLDTMLESIYIYICICIYIIYSIYVCIRGGKVDSLRTTCCNLRIWPMPTFGIQHLAYFYFCLFSVNWSLAVFLFVLCNKFPIASLKWQKNILKHFTNKYLKVFFFPMTDVMYTSQTIRLYEIKMD